MFPGQCQRKMAIDKTFLLHNTAHTTTTRNCLEDSFHLKPILIVIVSQMHCLNSHKTWLTLWSSFQNICPEIQRCTSDFVRTTAEIHPTADQKDLWGKSWDFVSSSSIRDLHRNTSCTTSFFQAISHVTCWAARCFMGKYKRHDQCITLARSSSWKEVFELLCVLSVITDHWLPS